MNRKFLACTLVGLSLPLVSLVAWVCWPERGADQTRWVAVQDRWVQVDAFLPRTTYGQHPAVVLLHGVEGAERNSRSRARLARDLANEGFATFIVHYFDACEYEDLWLFDGERLDLAAIEDRCRADAERWVDAVAAALRSIAERPDVDPRRIALDGYSLGGFVSLAVADRALDDGAMWSPAALVVHWGGRFDVTTIDPGFPPTLFIHGERDDVVSPRCAEEACRALTAAGGEAELLVVPGAGHVARTLESDAAVLRFLTSRLGKYCRPLPPAERHPEFAWADTEGALGHFFSASIEMFFLQ